MVARLAGNSARARDRVHAVHSTSPFEHRVFRSRPTLDYDSAAHPCRIAARGGIRPRGCRAFSFFKRAAPRRVVPKSRLPGGAGFVKAATPP
ncbi:MAG: hypothetical protein EBZ59_01040 [Planctomycetia bacterium]|nr:hypothetical protein [Planctomycetia bacterium]